MVKKTLYGLVDVKHAANAINGLAKGAVEALEKIP